MVPALKTASLPVTQAAVAAVPAALVLQKVLVAFQVPVALEPALAPPVEPLISQ